MIRQCMTVLVTRQDELENVYKARRKDTVDKNVHVTIFTTEKNELDENINGIIKNMADQNAQIENNDEDSSATVAIATIENNKEKKLVIFFLIHNFTDYENDASAQAHKITESAHAHKITETAKDQLESFYRNPDNLEDLQWTSKKYQESFRHCFLESFTSCNIDLRAYENYYMAETARYTTIQHNLLPVDTTPCKNDKHSKNIKTCNSSKLEKIEKSHYKNDKKSNIKCNSLKLEKYEKPQHYRTILSDREDKKKKMNKENLAKANILLEQSENLRQALQQAASMNMMLLINSVTDLNEIVLAENESSEKARNEEEKNLQKMIATEMENLKIKKRQLENQERSLEQRTQNLIEREEAFKKHEATIRKSLREERRLLDRQRHCIDQDRNDLTAEQKELERLDSARADCHRGEERTLDGKRRNLEHEIHKFDATKEDFEHSNELNATRLRLKETSLDKEKMDLEYEKLNFSVEREQFRQQAIFDAARIQNKTKLLEQQELELQNEKSDLAAEREKIRQQEISNANNLREMEKRLKENYQKKMSDLEEWQRRMQRNYENQMEHLKELEQSIALQRRDLQLYQQTLLRQKEEIDEYAEYKASSLRKQERNMEREERSMERQRQNLERESYRLKEEEKARQEEEKARRREEERARRRESHTIAQPLQCYRVPFVPIESIDDSIEIPIIPRVWSWKIRPFWRR